jgi:CPA1 family monovalent cation:H+ antiporter
LNAVLFVLIGLEVLLLQFTTSYLLAGLLAVPIVLLARWVSVGIPVTVSWQCPSCCWLAG